MPKFWNFLNKPATDTAPDITELRIDGEIVDSEFAWLYEWAGIKATTPNAFKAELAAFKGKPVTVWIDSAGGSVFAAAGMYNALMEHKGGVTVKIDGKALSAASVIAMAGDEIHMSPVALMMIHNPLTAAQGDMHMLRHMADVLDTVKETIVNAYQLKTKKSRAKISEMMDVETWMSAKAAIKDGFAHKMLYADEAEPITAYSPVFFNRRAIQNSAAESMKKLMELGMERPFQANGQSGRVYAVDFDGTLCANTFPAIGPPNRDIVDLVKNLRSEGSKIILWTCRGGEQLQEAVDWCAGQGIELDSVNENLKESVDQYGSDPRKVSAAIYIDDKAVSVKEIRAGIDVRSLNALAPVVHGANPPRTPPNNQTELLKAKMTLAILS